MAVTFKCLSSGQTVTFIHQVDIDSMKGHDGYEEVITEQEPVVTKKTAKKSVDTVTTEEV